MKNLACILRFKHGAICGKPLVKASADSIDFHARKKSTDLSHKYAQPRGCLPWETEENKDLVERKKCHGKDHDELEVTKKEYPMMLAVKKKYIPGCPAPGWQEIILRSKQKSDSKKN